MIESNETTNTEVAVDPNVAAAVTDTTVAVPDATNVTTNPVDDANTTSTSATDVPPVVTDPTSNNNIIEELKAIYKQIDSLKEQLDVALKQRDQLLANSDACGSVKQEINRLLEKLVPYANCFANFIQSLQNNLNNIEISAKVDPEFFSNLTSFADNYEPNDEEVTKIVSNLGGTISNRSGYSPLAILSSFNSVVKNSARLNAEVGNDHNRNVFVAVKPSKPVPVAS